MFSLESELFKKRQEIKSKQSGSSSAEIVRKQHKLKGVAQDTKNRKPEKNAGVEERNARDLAQNEEGEDKSKKVRSVLEAKSKLYEKMITGNILPDEESSAMFLVDFEKKSIDAKMQGENLDEKAKRDVNVASQLSIEIDKASRHDEEWVEYTDGLGRTRQCLRKDVPEMKRIDRKLGIPLKKENDGKTLLSNDMRREMEREKWEEEGLNGPVYYESLRSGEIRELGVGYYTFSTDQEMREKQIKMLQKMREETEKEKKNLKESEKHKRTALQARLERVRLGRIKKLKSQGKEIPAKLQEPVKLPEITEGKSETVLKAIDDVTVVEVTKRDDRDRTVREWDEGKDWTPAELPKPPKSWNDPREDRPDEFAPPSFYYKGQSIGKNISTPKVVTEAKCSRETSSDSIDSNTTSDSLETPSDLISRIRKDLMEVAKSSSGLIADSAKTSVNNSVDTKSTTSKDVPYATVPSSGDKTASNMYVRDKPITMKVKVLPKSNLLSKSAFNDG